MTGSGKELVPVGRGRPSLYSEDVADEIVDRMCHGQTLISVCRVDRQGNMRLRGEFPSHVTVGDWADPGSPSYRPAFSTRFARARLEQQRYWLEETIDIANTPEMGEEEMREYSAKNGITVRRVRKDMLHHRALKIDTRLKAIAKLNPALWAERLQQAASAGNDIDKEPNRLIIEGGLPDRDESQPSPPPPAEGEVE